jgi:thioredoxin reductase (NADPH)
VVEAVAPGGQAGTTSMIENYLGFPNGISGSELATRAVVQARRFGAELLLARPLVDVSADGPGYVAELSDGTLIRGRAVLFASGVEWRRLEVPGIDDLLGAGVYYGAGPSEALACTGSQVVVVGGGNSAGQAVVRFSRYARQVTLLVSHTGHWSWERHLLVAGFGAPETSGDHGEPVSPDPGDSQSG